MMATGLLLAQQAQASSFVVLGGEPVASPRSVLMLGEPAAVVVAATASAAPPPDRSIETSALGAPDRPESGSVATPDPDPRYVVAWPPRLSRSMVAFGEPLPVETRTAALAPRPPLSLPAVFRGGLAGDAFKSAPTPARAAVEQPAAEKTRKPAGGASPNSGASTVAERKDTAPLKPQDKAPPPSAPPSVPATPPPTIRLE